eukprot:10916703-Heterocapsa_arctica.AAC.1
MLGPSSAARRRARTLRRPSFAHGIEPHPAVAEQILLPDHALRDSTHGLRPRLQSGEAVAAQIRRRA